MNTSPSIVAPTASLANKGRLEHLLSRLGSESEHIGALQMLSSTAAIAPPSTRRKRSAEASIDREASSSDGGLPTDSALPQDETTLQRAKKMQEKNKRAQARYRQRQREKMEGLDEQVIKLSSRVKDLAQANEELHQQKLALQQALEQQRCGRCGGSARPALPAPGPPVSQPLPPPKALTLQQPGAALRSYNPLADAAGQIDMEHFEIFVPHILKVSAGRQLSSEQLAQPKALVSSLTPQDWYLVYKSFVSDLAMHLMESDKELNPSASASAEKLILGKRRLTVATHDCMGPQVSQEKLEAKNIIHMEPNRQFGPPPPNMWAKVAAAANFTVEQKQVILNVRHQFLEKLQDIIRQRRAIIAELHDSVPDFKSGANGHATITKAFQASHHLCESIVHEHEIVWTFLKEVCHNSMSPLQEARLMVASFPFFPDTPAICNALANEARVNAAESNTLTPEDMASGLSAQSSLVAPDKRPNAAMSAIFDGMRRDSFPATAARAEAASTSDPGNSASTHEGLQSRAAATAQLGEPRLSDTFGLSDMWATQQPLLLDSAWVAALPDLPLGGLPGAFSGGGMQTDLLA